MACPRNAQFNNVSHYGDPLLIEEIEHNLKRWLDWSFLKIGSWQEVYSDTSGTNGGSFSRLLPLKDNLYQDNTVYFSIRKDWVYETGSLYLSPTQDILNIEHNSTHNKTQVNLSSYETSRYKSGSELVIKDNSDFNGEYDFYSGLSDTQFLIDDSSSPSGTGGYVYGKYYPIEAKVFVDGVEQTSGYSIDYPNGKVIFDTQQDTNAIIEAEYAFRNVQCYLSNDQNWNLEVQSDSMDPTNLSWSNDAASGDFSSDPSQRVQLPAVIIESVSKRSSLPFELGSSKLKIKQDVLLTIVSQNKYERNIITDIIANQKNNKVFLYDIDIANKMGFLPLTHDGDINPSGLEYSDIINRDDIFWGEAYISDTSVSSVETKNPNLFMSKVRYEMEVIK